MSPKSATLSSVREILMQESVDALWVSHTDIHHNEYVPECYQRLGYVTGFTGSAGLGLIALDQACLFVDGRYTLQAPKEVDNALWQVDSLNYELIQVWIKDKLPPKSVIAYDPWLMTFKEEKQWITWGQEHGYIFKALSKNPIDTIWAERPSLPLNPIVLYPVSYAGERAQAKCQRLAQVIRSQGAEVAVLTQPESIAWLLNLRGKDVATTPIFLSFAALDHHAHVSLWLDSTKIPKDMEVFLEDITLYPYDPTRIAQDLKAYKTVMIDPAKAPSALVSAFEERGIKVAFHEDITLLPKALKNVQEQQGMREAHIQDGIALCRCLQWIEETRAQRTITELDVVEKLYEFRSLSPDFKGVSFDTIAASGPHGAIVHYKPSFNSNRPLQDDDLFLLDSGGQYWQGTTDVTRTLSLGSVTKEYIEAYTAVLQGHIALDQARFPVGTTGSQLDTLARYALWQKGMDYAHGTGHGVGSYLSVHEGPQGISKRASSVFLRPGMVLSNEPGYYKTGSFGIRIESLLMVRTSTFEEFLTFETLTFAPMDLRLIDFSSLSKTEYFWVKEYHQWVYDTLVQRAPDLESYLGRHLIKE